MTHYEFHEYASIFPMLEGEELEALRADIEENGQINKIGSLAEFMGRI